MGHNSKRIVIPVEIKQRELTGKLLLTLELVNRGHTVFLGSMDQHTAIDKLQPDIYFELSAVNRDGRRSRLRRLKECDVTTLILDTEGSVFGDNEDFRLRASNNIFAYTDCYCAWGSKSADIASEENQHKDLRVEVTGNPRFDLLHDSYRQIYSTESREIKEEYGEFILFNTNFSINRIDLDQGDEWAPTDMTETYKKQTRLIGEFISAVGSLSGNLTNHNIIVRPHPIEDPSLYQRLLFPYENVYIKKGGEVRPWILASDAVIHNSCTTGVTSALLETPVFAYTPQDITLSSIPNEVSNTCHTQSELIEKVTAVANSDADYTMGEKQKSRLRPYIDNIDYSSAERIADIIDSMEHQQPSGFKQRLKPPIKHRVKRQVVRVVGSDRFGPIYYERLRGGGSTSYKFSKTTLEEMESLVSCFPDTLIPDNLSISQVPGVVYSFKFEAENNT